jgi:hypothetical protein
VIIYKDKWKGSDDIFEELQEMGLRVLSFDQLEQIGNAAESVIHHPPSPDDVAFIMYTR